MTTPKVFVVSVLGLEGDFEAVAAFSYRNEAEDYVSRLKFCSWAIEELAVDEESVGGTHKPQPSNSPVITDGWVMVPRTPSSKHLESIATRHRHDFYLIDDVRRESALAHARQMYEESTGQGYYKLPAPPKTE